jgi:adenylate kinase
MKLVLLGAPGSGKGTQAPPLTERYGICHLSTGDLLRAAVANKTPEGIMAKQAMDEGRLVTDDIVFGVLRAEMKKPSCKDGYVIDGIPRTLAQAQEMEKTGIEVQKAVAFDVPDDVIIARTSGRWIHRASGRTYHTIFHPPKVTGKDDVTGEDLMQRADDKAEVVTKRLVIYHRESTPIEEYYAAQGKLEVINANRPSVDVRATLFALLDRAFNKKQ